MFEIKRDDRENSQSLVRRFSKRIKSSGIISGAKKARFQEREKSHQMMKRSALRRVQLKKEFELAEKMDKPAKARGYVSRYR